VLRIFVPSLAHTEGLRHVGHIEEPNHQPPSTRCKEGQGDRDKLILAKQDTELGVLTDPKNGMYGYRGLAGAQVAGELADCELREVAS
jgi:hypothetical protein